MSSGDGTPPDQPPAGRQPPPGQWSQPGGYGASPQRPYSGPPSSGGQPAYGAGQYGQYSQQYGAYGPPSGPVPLGPPPSGPRSNRVVLIALTVAVVVVVAGIGAAFALTGHSSKKSPLAGGSSLAPAGGSFSASASFPTQSASAPVVVPTDSVTSPSVAVSSASSTSSGDDGADEDCTPGESADLSAVSLTTVLSFVQPGEPGNSFVQAVIKRCATPAVRGQFKVLYGKSFALPGTDRTGGDNTGQTARYVMSDGSGGKLTMTLTLGRDNRYVCTGIRYSG